MARITVANDYPAFLDIDQTEARVKELDGLGDIHLLAKPCGAEELHARIGPLLGSDDGTS